MHTWDDEIPGKKPVAYRRSQSRCLKASGSRSGIRLTDIWSAIRFTLWCLVYALVKLWELNPVSLVVRRWRQLHYLNTRMALSIRPRLVDLATDFFLSDERRKRKLLSWVKSILPWVGEEVFDFTACWQDGIVLCALMEAISPGACPRFNLLKPHHRVNNCRLGIQLAMRYLQVSQLPLSPEEMAIADEDCEVKICHLIQLLKWKYQKQGNKPRVFSNLRIEEPFLSKCQARGTGIRAGIVGRRTKFNVLTDTVTRLDIQIEIRGPNNEYNKEKIVSMHNGVLGRYRENVVNTNIPSIEDDGKTKVIEDGAGHSFLRQRSLDEDLGHLIIPFDYQCVGEGRFLVTYIPRSAGLHYITILSHGVHIQGSPFEVKVSDWVSSWNLMPKPRVVPFDMLQTIEERPKDSLKPSVPSDKLKRQMSHVAHVSKHLTLMKRRILKKVITHNGEEIICDMTPSPTLSRQSSADFSDFSEDELRKTRYSGSPREKDTGDSGLFSYRSSSRDRSSSRGTSEWRKMFHDIEAVVETPEVTDNMPLLQPYSDVITPSSSTSSISTAVTSTSNNSTPRKIFPQQRRHLAGTIHIPGTQPGDLPYPEIVITPEDDRDRPPRLMYDSDRDLLSTEPNSPEDYDTGVVSMTDMSTAHVRKLDDRTPSLDHVGGVDHKHQDGSERFTSGPKSRTPSPMYKATDIVDSFLDTLKQSQSDRNKQSVADKFQATRQSNMSSAVGVNVEQVHEGQRNVSSSLTDNTNISFDNIKQRKLASFHQWSISDMETNSGQSSISEINAGQYKHTFDEDTGEPLIKISRSVLTAATVEGSGDRKTLAVVCPECSSSVSFLEGQIGHVGADVLQEGQCFENMTGQEELCKVCKHQNIAKLRNGNLQNDSPGENANIAQPGGSCPEEASISNFDKDFIDHMKDVYETNNKKLNGNYKPKLGSSSFDFSDFQPYHKITWSQHKSFTEERKLRKSLSYPYRAESFSDRSSLGKGFGAFNLEQLDLIKGLSRIESPGSETSDRLRNNGVESTYDVKILTSDAIGEIGLPTIEDQTGPRKKDERSLSLPETIIVLKGESRSETAASADAASRRDQLAKTKKWNTFDGDAWIHDSLGGGVTLTRYGTAFNNGAVSNNASNNSAFDNSAYKGSDKRTSSESELELSQLGDEDEILQIVIESKRRRLSLGDGNADDESPYTPSITSACAEEESPNTDELNPLTSDENSPIYGLLAYGQSAASGQRDEAVGVSPFSGISNKSGNSDWSDLEDYKNQDNKEKNKDATRRYFLKGDWSPQFVDLYYHADTQSHQSSVKSLNAGSPFRQSNNSGSPMSAGEKDVPSGGGGSHAERSHSHDFKSLAVSSKLSNCDGDSGVLHHKSDSRRSSLEEEARCARGSRRSSKISLRNMPEQDANSYTGAYINSLSDHDNMLCPLYLKRRRLPRYICYSERKENPSIHNGDVGITTERETTGITPRRETNGLPTQRETTPNDVGHNSATIVNCNCCQPFCSLPEVCSFFSKLGLFSPAVSEHLNLFDNWSCLSNSYIDEAYGYAPCFGKPIEFCPECQSAFENMPYRIEYFQERTLTPTKYRNQMIDNSPQTNHGSSNVRVNDNSSSSVDSYGAEMSDVELSLIGRLSPGDRILTPTKFRRNAKHGNAERNICRTLSRDNNTVVGIPYVMKRRRSQNVDNFLPHTSQAGHLVTPMFVQSAGNVTANGSSIVPSRHINTPDVRLDNRAVVHVAAMNFMDEANVCKVNKQMCQEQETQTQERKDTLLEKPHGNITFTQEHVKDDSSHRQSLSQLTSTGLRLNDITTSNTSPSFLRNKRHVDMYKSTKQQSRTDLGHRAQQHRSHDKIQAKSSTNDNKISYTKSSISGDRQDTRQQSRNLPSHQKVNQPSNQKVHQPNNQKVHQPTSYCSSISSTRNYSKDSSTQQNQPLQSHTDSIVETNQQLYLPVTSQSYPDVEGDKPQEPELSQVPLQSAKDPQHAPKQLHQVADPANRSAVVRRQSTVDTLDSGITEDSAHFSPNVSNSDFFDTDILDLEGNFNIPFYIPLIN